MLGLAGVVLAHGTCWRGVSILSFIETLWHRDTVEGWDDGDTSQPGANVGKDTHAAGQTRPWPWRLRRSEVRRWRGVGSGRAGTKGVFEQVCGSGAIFLPVFPESERAVHTTTHCQLWLALFKNFHPL